MKFKGLAVVFTLAIAVFLTAGCNEPNRPNHQEDNLVSEQAKDLERALRAYDSESSRGWPAGDRDLVVNMIYKVESSVPEGNLHLVVLRLQDDRVRMFLISDELTVGKWYKASNQRRLLPFSGD